MVYCNYSGAAPAADLRSAGMVELADTMDLGSIGQPCRFKSCYPHQTNIIRTRFRLAMGSDYLFSLTATKASISATG